MKKQTLLSTIILINLVVSTFAQTNNLPFQSSTSNIVNTIVAPPWIEPFSIYTTPTDWDLGNWSVGLAGGREGNPGAQIYKYFDATLSSNIFSTTTIGPIASGNILSFDYRILDNSPYVNTLPAGWGKCLVQISNNNGPYVTIDSITNADDRVWTNKSYSLTAYTGQNIKVRIVAYRNAGFFYIAFDNFQVYSPPATDLAVSSINFNYSACPRSNVPISLTIKNKGLNPINFASNNAQLTLNLYKGNNIIQGLYIPVNSGVLAPDSSRTVFFNINADFSSGGIFSLIAQAVVNSDGNSYNDVLNGLYSFSYRSVVPWTEPFQTSSTPTGWGVGGWSLGSYRGATGNPGSCLYKNLNSFFQNASFSTPSLGPLPVQASSTFSFDYQTTNYVTPYSAAPAGVASIKLYISIDCGVTFNAVDSFLSTSGGWTRKNFSLTGYAGQIVMPKIIVDWKFSDYDIAFDNFELTSQPICTAPEIRNADSITTTTTATIYFNGYGNSFIAEYGPVGFTPGTGSSAGNGGTVIAVTGSPINITGLTPNNTYQIYVRQNCTTSGIGFSANSVVDSFKTKVLYQNDLPKNAIALVLGAGCTGATYNNIGATKITNEPGVPCSGPQNTGASVWFKFAAPASGFVKISTDGSSNTLADTRIALYAVTDSSNFSSFQLLACDDDNGVLSSTSSTIYSTGLTPGLHYYVVVDDYNGTQKGNFCIQVNEVNTTMIAGTGNCTEGQTVPEFRADYKGWVSLTNSSGQLIANVRSNTTLSSIVSYTPYLTVNTGSVRQSATGEYYLNRNTRIVNALSGNYDVQFFLLNTELIALQAVAPTTSLSNLNVTKVKGETACNTNFVSGGTANDTLLLQTSTGQANSISWVTVNTTGFSNFYLHPGAMQLSRVYIFTGNGSWSNPANWQNNEVPPLQLPAHCAIEIKPVAGGQCILDVIQHVPAGSTFRVKTGTNIVIPGSIIIQ